MERQMLLHSGRKQKSMEVLHYLIEECLAMRYVFQVGSGIVLSHISDRYPPPANYSQKICEGV